MSTPMFTSRFAERKATIIRRCSYSSFWLYLLGLALLPIQCTMASSTPTSGDTNNFSTLIVTTRSTIIGAATWTGGIIAAVLILTVTIGIIIYIYCGRLEAIFLYKHIKGTKPEELKEKNEWFEPAALAQADGLDTLSYSYENGLRKHPTDPCLAPMPFSDQIVRPRSIPVMHYNVRYNDIWLGYDNRNEMNGQNDNGTQLENWRRARDEEYDMHVKKEDDAEEFSMV